MSTSVYDYETPANYEYGTMGGYLTYDQVLATLDEMAEMYALYSSPSCSRAQ